MVEKTNMYGCTDCPQCGSRYRCVFESAPTIIDCDDCGFKEPITPENYDLFDEVES